VFSVGFGVGVAQSLSVMCNELNDRDYVRFEVFTAVTMKNGVFWVVTPCGSLDFRWDKICVSVASTPTAGHTRPPIQ
jgi:hypothetical protein